MFPLLGVVLTGGSFVLLWTSTPGTAPTNTGMPSVRPEIFYGVIFGAAMALLNHVFVLSATRCLNNTLLSADQEFSDWIDREPTVRIDELVTQLKQSVVEYDELMRSATRSLTESTVSAIQSFGEIAVRVQGATKGFDVASGGLVTQIDRLSTEIGTFATGLQIITQRSATNMETAERSFVSSADAIKLASQRLESAPAALKEGADQLRAACLTARADADTFHVATSQATESVKRIGEAADEAARRLVNVVTVPKSPPVQTMASNVAQPKSSGVHQQPNAISVPITSPVSGPLPRRVATTVSPSSPPMSLGTPATVANGLPIGPTIDPPTSLDPANPAKKSWLTKLVASLNPFRGESQ